ncbi:MAG TPA: ArsA-related P-loop ATPase, partial [Vicinamibacterales bacterium]|nr:ArsA-related P-loop ATPase [Vicinamibacterales bacterium]
RGMRATTPLMQLQDPKQTKVVIVTLAETTPVLEAAGLQADLRRAGIEPWAWVINQSLSSVATSSPLLQHRAANERARIEEVAAVHAGRYAVVGLQPVEPVGVERLAALAEPHRSSVAG